MKETIRNLRKVYKYGKNYKLSLILQVVGSIIGLIISISVPIVTSKYIVSFTNSYFKQAILMSFVLYILFVFREAKTVLIRKNTQILHAGIVSGLSSKLGYEILKIEQNNIDRESSGTFISRIINDTENMAAMFTTGCGNLFGVLSNFGSFIAVLIIDYHVFLYYLFCTIILTLISIFKADKFGKKSKLHKKQCDKVAGLTGELIRGTRDIKMLYAKKSFMSEYDKNISLKTDYYFDMRNVDIKYNFIIGLLKKSMEFIVVIFLIYLINKNVLSIAIALALYNYKDSVITNLMASITSLIDEAKEFNISCDRVFELINSKKFKKEEFGDKHLDKIDGSFEFKNVSFGYDDRMILNDLSFKIESGTTIGFVGKSGAGKTTIFNLLCKLYSVKSGDILIDGININELDESSIRGNITIISQNPYIFNMSIRDNFRLVKNNLSDEEMINACKVACLDDFINTLPDKYDTVVGEGGVNLSGGQRQRLAIARALVQDTKIILFDEATSALDNETQASIQQAIDNLKGDYTIMIIAHRLSTIVNCDNIMYLKDGKIDDYGTHQELLKNKDYKKLCESEILINGE